MYAAGPQGAGPSHRRLGEQLDLFSFDPRSPGAPYWHGRGLAVVEALIALWREGNAAAGFEEVRTPILHDLELWQRSGHAEKFADGMFRVDDDGRELALKPMSCPAHVALYQRRRRSAAELPVRYAELGLVHRREPSGSLNGVLRARQFTQDDAHIFCRPDQVQVEVASCLRVARAAYELLDLRPRAELSLRPEQRLGSDAEWDAAEAALAGALAAEGVEHDVAAGEGAFYGPKIDLHVLDRAGRSWQLGTVQLDLQLPRRFELRYDEADGGQGVPVMIHRAVFGSFERIVGVLLEHMDGQLPLWLAPVAVAILPRSESERAYADEVAGALAVAGVRGSVDARAESLGRRVRDAERSRVPVILVVGPREAGERSVSLRRRGLGEQGALPLGEAVQRLGEEVRLRRG
jgi:threonyl-tRNA synthetase